MTANKQRATRQTKAVMPGTMSMEIIAGDYIVKHMHAKSFGFGEMNTKCRHCQAFKFKKETPGLCCSGGTVQLAPFPPPPQEMHDYWFANTDLALLFRDNSRCLLYTSPSPRDGLLSRMPSSA